MAFGRQAVHADRHEHRRPAVSVELRGRRGVAGHLQGLQAHAVTLAAAMLLFVVAVLRIVTGVASLGLSSEDGGVK